MEYGVLVYITVHNNNNNNNNNNKQETRKMLTMYKMHHPKADIDRLYI